jgi:formate dehydrogenase subunit gamma
VNRFTVIERFAHRAIAILMVILIGTAAALYIPDISILIGNRGIVKTIHSVSGFLLPIPLIIAVVFPVFRMNMRELNRFHPHDFAWLKRQDSSSIRPELINPDPVYGKFNAGQKLNASFSLGSIVIMFATGMVMFFSSLFTDNIRTGATFVHDWLTLAIVIAVGGHIYMAMKDPQARDGMRTGSVTKGWAKQHHPQWLHVNSGLSKTSGSAEPKVHPVDEDQGHNQ